MINPTQIRADFEKMRSPDHEHGEVVTLAYGGSTCRALMSGRTRTVQIHEYGEEIGDLFSVRFLATDFDNYPTEKDTVQVDGVEYQVGEARLSGFQQIVRLYLMDPDS